MKVLTQRFYFSTKYFLTALGPGCRMFSLENIEVAALESPDQRVVLTGPRDRTILDLQGQMAAQNVPMKVKQRAANRPASRAVRRAARESWHDRCQPATRFGDCGQRDGQSHAHPFAAGTHLQILIGKKNYGRNGLRPRHQTAGSGWRCTARPVFQIQPPPRAPPPFSSGREGAG